MQNLTAWLANIDVFCGSILREPTSGLHKMNLVLALRSGKRALQLGGRGENVDRLAAHLVETADAVRLQIWDAPFKNHYLGEVRKLVERLRCEVAALVAAIEDPQNVPLKSLVPIQSSRVSVERSAKARMSKGSSTALWKAVTRVLRLSTSTRPGQHRVT